MMRMYMYTAQTTGTTEIAYIYTDKLHTCRISDSYSSAPNYHAQPAPARMHPSLSLAVLRAAAFSLRSLHNFTLRPFPLSSRATHASLLARLLALPPTNQPTHRQRGVTCKRTGTRARMLQTIARLHRTQLRPAATKPSTHASAAAAD